jgi:HSP20 family protein
MATATEKFPPRTLAPARRLTPSRMEELMRDVERFWERSFPFRFDLLRREPLLPVPEFDWSPHVDLFEEKGELVLRADLPGMKKENVAIYFEEGDLVLKGEREESRERKEKDFFRSECTYGSFYRRIPVGFEIDPKLVHAKMDNGVLELKIPMPPKTKPEPKRIAIT